MSNSRKLSESVSTQTVPKRDDVRTVADRMTANWLPVQLHNSVIVEELLLVVGSLVLVLQYCWLINHAVMIYIENFPVVIRSAVSVLPGSSDGNNPSTGLANGCCCCCCCCWRQTKGSNRLLCLCVRVVSRASSSSFIL